MVSVVIPTYNRVLYLKEALDSVLTQTYQDFEIIVVDDNSTDNTKDLIDTYIALYKDIRIKYFFINGCRQGAARNKGIVNSNGEFIAFLDSDDMWLPNHLECCMEVFEIHKDAGVVFSGSYIVNEKGEVLSKIKTKRFGQQHYRDIIVDYSSGGCNASSCIVKKDCFYKAGYFCEKVELAGSEDWEMWARLSFYTKFVSTSHYTVKIRNHPLKKSLETDKMAISMKLALDLIYANHILKLLISDIKKRAYSSLYIVIAQNYYAAGRMDISRSYLKSALNTYPMCIIQNKYFLPTYLKTFLGNRFSVVLRQIKYFINSKINKLSYDKI